MQGAGAERNRYAEVGDSRIHHVILLGGLVAGVKLGGAEIERTADVDLLEVVVGPLGMVVDDADAEGPRRVADTDAGAVVLVAVVAALVVLERIDRLRHHAAGLAEDIGDRIVPARVGAGMDRRAGNRVDQQRLRIEDGAGHARRELAGVLVSRRVLASESDGAKAAPQPGPGLAVELPAGAGRRARADIVALFEHEHCLEAVAQVLAALEADPRSGQHAADDAGEGGVAGLGVADTDIGDAVDRDVGLGKRGGAGDGCREQRDRSVMHRVNLRWLSFLAGVRPCRAPQASIAFT